MTNYDTSLLYGFSVIPQVLASLIALLGVFLLFKFQSLNSTIISFGEQTIDFFNKVIFLRNIRNETNVLELLINRLSHGIIRKDPETVASQVAGIISTLKDIEISFSGGEQTEREEKNILSTINHNNEIQFACLNLRNDLRMKFKTILIYSVLLIIFSILCLPLVPLFSGLRATYLMIITFFLCLLWLMYCLLKIFHLIQLSFKRDY